MSEKRYSIFALFFFLIVCYGAAALGGWFTSMTVGNWYVELAKPSWNPPSSVFAPVWTFLYGCMAVAGWLVFSAAPLKKTVLALSLFAAQLAFNVAWSGLFFALKNPFVAFIDVLALWGFILATMVSFAKFSKFAAFLFFLYFAWVSFAVTLNYAIFSLNG